MERLDPESARNIPDDSLECEDIEWMPTRRIADYVGKSFDWVQARVAIHSHESKKLPGKRGLHFPPHVTRALKIEADALQSHPVVSDNDIAINGLSIILERDEKWIAARTPFLGITPTDKLNPVNNRVFSYYNKETDLPLLQVEDERMKSYPVATFEYASIEEIASILGHERKWVLRRLRYIATHPTVMMNPAINQLGLFYHLSHTIEQIEELPKHLSHLAHRETIAVHPVENVKTYEDLEFKRELAGTDKKPYEPSGIEKPDASNWRDYALCAETNIELFVDPRTKHDVERAKKVCGKCSVRLFCLDYAITTGENTGVWGGMSALERKKLQRTN